MGALVGGLEAADALDEFAEWATTLNQRSVLRLLDPTWAGAGMFRAEKILDVVRDLLNDTAIEDLPMPFTAVATDLIAGKSVWLQRGALAAAIRASIAIPGVIAPHILDGRVLADGGVLDSLPVAPLAGIPADLRIAVSVSAPDSQRSRDGEAAEANDAKGTGKDSKEAGAADRLNWLLRSKAALMETDTAQSLLGWFGGGAEPGEESGGESGRESEEADAAKEAVLKAATQIAPKLTSFEVMNRTIDVMQSALARMQLATYPPDILIEVPRSTSRSLDFHRAAEVIEIGRERAARALDAYEGTVDDDPAAVQPEGNAK